MATTTRAQIDAFLSLKRIAVVGVSRSPREFSRALFQEFRRRKYDAVPVNPAAAEVDDTRCYSSVVAISPKVDGAFLITPPALTSLAVRDCDAAGIRNVWIWGGAGAGCANQDALSFCQSCGISAISGHCPFMFFPGTQLVHRLHGFFKRLTGSYPR